MHICIEALISSICHYLNVPTFRLENWDSKRPIRNILSWFSLHYCHLLLQTESLSFHLHLRLTNKHNADVTFLPQVFMCDRKDVLVLRWTMHTRGDFSEIKIWPVSHSCGLNAYLTHLRTYIWLWVWAEGPMFQSFGLHSTWGQQMYVIFKVRSCEILHLSLCKCF